MVLSNELLSEFVKITNDTPKKSTEGTVYGTVKYDGRWYVQVDESGQLTPVSTTTDIKDGDKVIVTIKDHTATVTGNLTSPAARTDDVKDVDAKVDSFNIVITKQIQAEQARVDTLVAENVTIKDSLKASSADISDLKADTVTINEKLTANEAEIKRLETEKIDATAVEAKYATIESLDATNANVNNLSATHAEFKEATIKDLNAHDASIKNLDANVVKANEAILDRATIDDLDAVKADVKELEAGVADIDTLIFGSASGNTIQTSFANAVIAQLGNAQIKAAMIENISADQIKAGAIDTNNVRVLSKDGKLIISDETIQISDSSRVRVQIGKDASGDYSINIWDADGKLMFSEGGITDNAIKEAIIRNDMVSDDANISASKLDISSLFKVINEDGSHTLNSSKILMDSDNQTLNVAFKSVTDKVDTALDDISSQGTDISVIKGQISSKIWTQDITTATNSLKNTEIKQLNDKYTSLDQSVDGVKATVASHTTQIQNKADSSTVTSVTNRVTTLETNLEGFKSEVSSTYATRTDMDKIEVGCRNLVLGTDVPFEIQNTSEFTSFRKSKNYKLSSVIRDNPKEFLLSLKDGAALAFSFEVYAPAAYKNSNLTLNRIGAYVSFKFTRISDNKVTFWYMHHSGPDYATSRHTFRSTNSLCSLSDTELDYTGYYACYTIPSNNAALSDFYANPDNYTVTEGASVNADFYGYYKGGAYIKNIKLEIGNRTSDWTPAPEDVNADIQAVNDKFASYSTTTEMNSAIDQRADSIELSVSEVRSIATNAQNDIDNLEVGGRNLATNTSTPIEVTSTTATGTNTWTDSTAISYYDKPIYIEPNTEYVLSFDYTLDWSNVASGMVSDIAGVGIGTGDGTRGSYTSDTWESTGKFKKYGGSDESGRFVYVLTPVTQTNLYFAFRPLRSGGADITGLSVVISNFKLEKGNTPTDWTPAPEDVSEDILEAEDRVNNVISDKETSILATSESVILSALKSYAEKGDYEEFKSSVSAQLAVLSNEIKMSFTNATTQITNVDSDLQSKFVELYKYITFGENGISISAGTDEMELVLDNDVISFRKNGVQFGWWDGNNFHTGNIVIKTNERAQFGNFAFIPRSDYAMQFLKVSGPDCINLLANSDIEYTRVSSDTTKGMYSINLTTDVNLQSLIGQQLTLSYIQHTPGDRDTSLETNTIVNNRFGMHGYIEWSDSTGVKTSTTPSYPFTNYLTTTTTNTRVSETATITVPAGYDTIETFRLSVNIYAKPASGNTETWVIGYPKLEIGSEDTGWSPAPDDILGV